MEPTRDPEARVSASQGVQPGSAPPAGDDAVSIAESVAAGTTARDPQPRPRGRRVRRVIGWALIGLVGVAATALGVTAVLDAVDRRRIQPPGELVALADGRRLHVEVSEGPAAAGDPAAGQRPTVVLEAGSGGFSATMAWLHRELAEHTTVVSYDRAGYGFSDASEVPLSAATVVADLHEALDLLGIEGPYVLVGHSLGGGYVRAFAAEHPDEVAGLVLLDPVHEEQLTRLPAESLESLEQAQEQLAVAPTMARFGVFRVVDPQAAIVAALPEDAGERQRAGSVTAAGMRAYGREVAALPALLDELGQIGSGSGADTALGGVPVRIISAGQPETGESPQAREIMDALHEELAARSPLASRDVIADADHLRLVIDERHAREVAAIVVTLLDELDG